jgi:hypothetical protein
VQHAGDERDVSRDYLPALLREDNVRGALRRNMLGCPISQSAEIQAAKERFSLAKRNWNNSEVNFIHVGGLNVLLHGLDTAANLNVLWNVRRQYLIHNLYLNRTILYSNSRFLYLKSVYESSNSQSGTESSGHVLCQLRVVNSGMHEVSKMQLRSAIPVIRRSSKRRTGPL